MTRLIILVVLLAATVYAACVANDPPGASSNADRVPIIITRWHDSSVNYIKIATAPDDWFEYSSKPWEVIESDGVSYYYADSDLRPYETHAFKSGSILPDVMRGQGNLFHPVKDFGYWDSLSDEEIVSMLSEAARTKSTIDREQEARYNASG